jgi:hypothetical protein
LPFPPLPVPFCPFPPVALAVVAGAVSRPAANAIPPTANSAARTTSAVSHDAPPLRRTGTGGGGEAGETVGAGTGASGGSDWSVIEDTTFRHS